MKSPSIHPKIKNKMMLSVSEFLLVEILRFPKTSEGDGTPVLVFVKDIERKKNIKKQKIYV